MRKVRKSLILWASHKQNGTSHESINNAWIPACKKTEVKDARIHDIRHKAMTDMVSAGFSLEFAGRVGGHSSPSTTRRYVHLSVNATKEALESLGKKKLR